MGQVMFMRKGEIHTAPVGIPDFPIEPTEYELIENVTAAKTFTAPEDGYFKIEVFGASGRSGACKIYTYNEQEICETLDSGTDYCTTACDFNYGAGGGGGGGGTAISVVALCKGDMIALSGFSIGSTTSAAVSSSQGSENSITMSVTSGGDGGNGNASSSSASGGAGGSGGVATGGNIENYNGSAGTKGGSATNQYSGWNTPNMDSKNGIGGSAGYSGGNAGGSSVSYKYTQQGGKAGFVKIYRGNNNSIYA